MRSTLKISLCLSQYEMILRQDGRVLLLLLVVLSSLSQAGLFLIEVGSEESLGCGQGEQYGEKCYRLHLLPKSWQAAQHFCSRRAEERENY